ncbi:unnamed protein product [Cylicocyclus nassatus]|uniref:Calponin-homology (CH) domain-containing protein n=1 Tax=Cylicocyclus nassatus TaxID=53992 RepID=A0AA36HFZ6_CYLNA|nr:unnamed protein product [Cylicocyclus nassatus]
MRRPCDRKHSAKGHLTRSSAPGTISRAWLQSTIWSSVYSPYEGSMEKIFEEAELCGALNLSGRKMKEYPHELSNKYDLSDLISLDLSGNRLSDIPTCVCESRSLESLSLRDNALRSVPRNILFLRSLTVLDLSNNKIVQLPLSLFELPLEIVLLTGNRLDSIPREIRQLSSTLAELDVSCNFLKSIPPDIALLKMLRVLNLRQNLLECFPSELCRLSLHTLDLSCNRLKQLPSRIGKMNSLVELSVGNNPLQFPPASLILKGREHIVKWMDVETSAGLKRQSQSEDFSTSYASVTLDRSHINNRNLHEASLPPYVELRQHKPPSARANDNCERNSAPETNHVSEAVLVFGDENALSKAKPHSEAVPVVAENKLVTLQNGNMEEARKTGLRPASERLNSTDLSNNNLSVANNVCCTTDTPIDGLITKRPSPTPAVKSMAKTAPLLSRKSHPPSLNSEAQETKVSKTKIWTSSVSDSLEKKCRSPNSRILSSAINQCSPVSKTSNSPSRCTNQRSRLPSHIGRASSSASVQKSSSSSEQSRQSSVTKPLAGKTTRVTVVHSNRNGFSSKSHEVQLAPADLLKKIFLERLQVTLPDSLENIALELSDGVHLCSLVNALRAQTISSFFTSSAATLTAPKAKRNVDSFITSCRKLGISEKFICSPNDILNRRNTASIAKTVFALHKLFPQENATHACSLVVDKL